MSTAGRPRANANLVIRARAFELYAAGVKKSDIAASLSVTKAAISNWSKRDRWDDRLASLVQVAQQTADHANGEALARTFTELQAKLPQRLRELDQLCGPSNHPSTRLNAIKAWVTLARDLEAKATTKATDTRSLSLIDDYADKTASPYAEAIPAKATAEEVPPVLPTGATSPGDDLGPNHVLVLPNQESRRLEPPGGSHGPSSLGRRGSPVSPSDDHPS